ncbi:Hypothetical predicted protein [Olea europaea subsp. europaea]|uniref:J domain-containing protein n=1 Tax=Olea europaea subsp. europaea TaxID=158383 RepID=A0A8S0TT01_OLEEU|nr:Hypothetical predicted protein [Olea europaea subsp. europaea]
MIPRLQDEEDNGWTKTSSKDIDISLSSEDNDRTDGRKWGPNHGTNGCPDATGIIPLTVGDDSGKGFTDPFNDELIPSNPTASISAVVNEGKINRPLASQTLRWEENIKNGQDDVIIDVPESLPKKPQGSRILRKDKKWPFRTVICIDDDESTDDNHSGVGVNDNDSFSNGATHSKKSCFDSKEFENAAGSAGEECDFVQENTTPVRLSKCKRTYSGKASTKNVYGPSVNSEIDLSGNDSPDCELMEDSSGELRKQWEKAFFRRKKDKRNELKTHMRNNQPDINERSHSGAEYPPFNFAEQQSSFETDVENDISNVRAKTDKFEEKVIVSDKDMEHLQPCEPVIKLDLSLEKPPSSKKLAPEIPSSCNRNLNETQIREDDSCLDKAVEKLIEHVSNVQMEVERDDPQHTQYGDNSRVVENFIINEREKLKETEEYKKAIEEEWASRQRALQIQAEEAQHLKQLRKRQKAESMRLLDMERRQKQRVEEIRETQKKDEENMNLKEVIRSEVRTRLKQLETTCHDMASLLHSLGINLATWPHPSPHEVQTAYKRALLTFHPDRALQSDIRQQVEAEEKFKLINRLKDKFSASLSQ